jgi:hypothetical protein
MSPAVQSRVAWGAIFAGALVALALFLVLGSLWAAIDLSHADHEELVNPFFVAILSLSAMFFGGWTTARLCAGESTGEALFYGIILWSVTALAVLWLAINGIMVLGSATLLGQAGAGDAFPVSRTAAWWGFIGVVLSLIATLAGVLAGFTRHRGAARRARLTREALLDPALAP